MLRRVLGMAVLFSALTLAADVTGTWSGPMQMKKGDETHDDSAYLVLKQEGNVITGTVGPNVDKRMTITKGSIEDNALYIEAKHPERDAKMVLRLKLEGEKLTGELSAEGPEAPPISGKMTLTREKS
ncbi:MAG TPA: hypothetical protein VFL57_08520 [Bryobacteraceae bacterium]|nr:hypothetical protein [Bryobacteraceae bacterium]